MIRKGNQQAVWVKEEPPSIYGGECQNRIAGQNLERLTALSDGIFAVAMTLLVLDLHVPVSEVIHIEQPLWVNGAIQSEQALWTALAPLWPRLITYFMSFLTLGIFWVGQQTQLNHFARSDRHLAWIHLAFLLAVSLTPFSTALLAAFITYRIALVVYWLNIFLLGAVLFGSLRYAKHSGLMKPHGLRNEMSKLSALKKSCGWTSFLLCFSYTCAIFFSRQDFFSPKGS